MIELRGLHLGNIARCPAESVRPDLWPDHAWVPALGCTGGVLYDLCDQTRHGITSTPTWNNGQIYTGPSLAACPVIGAGVFETDSPGTIISSISRTDTTLGNSVTFGSWDQSLRALFFGLNSEFAPFLAVRGGSDGSAIQIAGGGVIAIGPSTMAASFSRQNAFLYLNGGIAQSISGALVGIGGAASGNYYIGYKSDGSLAQCSLIAAVVVYRRQLPHAAVAEMSADPLLPFRRRRPVFYSVPSWGGSIETPAAMMMAL